MGWLHSLVLVAVFALAPLASHPAAADLSGEEQEYVDDVTGITSAMSGSFDRFSELATDFRLGDPSWTTAVAAQLAVWKVSYQDYLRLDPPPAFAEAHRLLGQALALFDEAADDVADGLDRGDAGLLEEAADKIADATLFIGQATDALGEITDRDLAEDDPDDAGGGQEGDDADAAAGEEQPEASARPAPPAGRGFPASAVIRGENVPLLAEPAEGAEVVARLQRGDAVTITGGAEAADGEELVPVEVDGTGDAGWVPELYIDPESVVRLDETESGVDDGDDALGSESAGSTPPLDARLGGTVEAWEAEFGPPVEGESADLFTEFDLPGYSTVFADEYLGRIESISLFSPRPEGEEWSSDEPHPMDWTVAEAHDLALQFLPRDARCAEPDEDRVGGIMTECASDALAAEVPPEVYDYVDNTPEYGRCSYWLVTNLNDEGHVSNIIIELEIEEPLA